MGIERRTAKTSSRVLHQSRSAPVDGRTGSGKFFRESTGALGHCIKKSREVWPLVRGRTVIAALLDEVAFWRSETSSNPDVEVLAAVRPSMATIPGSMLLCASSPYARRGILWNAYSRHYGKDRAAPLVWSAPALSMNPTVPQSVIDAAMADDEAAALAEYGAQFRNDLEAFVKLDIVEGCVGSYIERAPDSLARRIYGGFCLHMGRTTTRSARTWRWARMRR
jgi:hypothetical protein